MPVKYPYSNLNTKVRELLSNQTMAKKAIEDWLYSIGLRDVTTLKVLALVDETSESVRYLEPSKIKFASINGSHFVSMRNVIFWTGQAHVNAYKQFYSNRSFIESLGVKYAPSHTHSTRLAAVQLLGLHQHHRMTSHITLFSPCSVVWFLITAKTENGQSFREFVKDTAPEKPYYPKKLVMTLDSSFSNQVKDTIDLTDTI
jgi:hypothetical protein